LVDSNIANPLYLVHVWILASQGCQFFVKLIIDSACLSKLSINFYDVNPIVFSPH
jgi:hypothetical protein